MSLKLFHHQFKAMGSPCELALYLEQESAQEVLTNVCKIIENYEAKYSRYQSGSILSIINQSAGSAAPISVDPETSALLNYADVLYHQSNGYFDITSGVLRTIWDFKKKIIPSNEKRKEMLEIIGWNKVSWNPPYIKLPNTMQLDFGGIVKEYVADTVANFCRQQGITYGLINLGGDIHVIGPHPNGLPWKIGIQHPRKAKTAITRIEIFEGAIATSGDYERCMIVDNKRYSHLLNPFTAEPIEGIWASVTVLAPQCVIAGSCSTIALLTSHELHEQWLKESGLPYLCITQDMEISGSISHHPDNIHAQHPDDILINSLH